MPQQDSGKRLDGGAVPGCRLRFAAQSFHHISTGGIQRIVASWRQLQVEYSRVELDSGKELVKRFVEQRAL